MTTEIHKIEKKEARSYAACSIRKTMAAPAFDAVTAIPSNDHAKLSSNQRDVGGSQANVSGWSPRKLAPVQHTTKMTRGEEPKDAVTGYRQASTMAAHLSPEEKHVGGRQESISGWSPKKMEEPGGNLASPPRLHDVVSTTHDRRRLLLCNDYTLSL